MAPVVIKDVLSKITGRSGQALLFLEVKLATGLALNGQPAEAQLWLKKVCKVSSASQCSALKEGWAWQSLQNPAIAAVKWPD